MPGGPDRRRRPHARAGAGVDTGEVRPAGLEFIQLFAIYMLDLCAGTKMSSLCVLGVCCGESPEINGLALGQTHPPQSHKATKAHKERKNHFHENGRLWVKVGSLW